jgi:hypothetical protein
MICDFPQIQGGPQIPFETNLWASLNLREVIRKKCRTSSSRRRADSDLAPEKCPKARGVTTCRIWRKDLAAFQLTHDLADPETYLSNINQIAAGL